MKATLIISVEYKHNVPSVFIMTGSEYYGDLTYPLIRRFPKDPIYWSTADSSDKERGFILKNIEYSKEAFERIQKLHLQIAELHKKLIDDNVNPWVSPPSASQNSMVYKEYLAKKEAHNKRQREIWDRNRSIDKEIFNKQEELRELLLNGHE